MPTGYVISDLHLFTPWSAAESNMREIRAAAARAEFLVLNGDIFDFRWSSLPSTEATLAAAEGWLRTFAAEHPQTRIIFVMGNHDGFGRFAERLDPLARDLPNFEWHASHVRIGTALFAHGDLLLRRNPVDPFERPLLGRIRRKPRAVRRCYRLLHAMRVHRWHTPVVSSRLCARRILRAVAAARNGEARGVTDVYFGHTHTTFSDYTHRGIRFHNTGSMIGGIPWHLMPVRIE